MPELPIKTCPAKSSIASPVFRFVQTWCGCWLHCGEWWQQGNEEREEERITVKIPHRSWGLALAFHSACPSLHLSLTSSLSLPPLLLSNCSSLHLIHVVLIAFLPLSLSPCSIFIPWSNWLVNNLKYSLRSFTMCLEYFSWVNQYLDFSVEDIVLPY